MLAVKHHPTNMHWTMCICRYKEDVALMRTMGIKYYRMSISWSRVLPTGRGRPNERGLAFYDRLIDELVANGIEPVVTLYHWDLPLSLQVWCCSLC